MTARKTPEQRVRDRQRESTVNKWTAVSARLAAEKAERERRDEKGDGDAAQDES